MQLMFSSCAVYAGDVHGGQKYRLGTRTLHRYETTHQCHYIQIRILSYRYVLNFFHSIQWLIAVVVHNNAMTDSRSINCVTYLFIYLLTNVLRFVRGKSRTSYSVPAANQWHIILIYANLWLLDCWCFLGQPIDSASNGRAPLPWEIHCHPTQMFHDETHLIEVPHTAAIVVCTADNNKLLLPINSLFITFWDMTDCYETIGRRGDVAWERKRL